MGKNEELERKVCEGERRVGHYRRRLEKLQGDYHNLIGITADLVDTLEATLQGRPVRPFIPTRYPHSPVFSHLLIYI